MEFQDKNRERQQQGHDIGQDHRQGIDDYAVNNPQSHAAAEEGKHRQRDVVRVLGFPGFDHLGHKGDGGEEASDQAEHFGAVHGLDYPRAGRSLPARIRLRLRFSSFAWFVPISYLRAKG